MESTTYFVLSSSVVEEQRHKKKKEGMRCKKRGVTEELPTVLTVLSTLGLALSSHNTEQPVFTVPCLA